MQALQNIVSFIHLKCYFYWSRFAWT